MERIAQFSIEEGQLYHSRLPASNLGRQTANRTVRTIPVRTVLRLTTCPCVRLTRSSPPPRATRETNRGVNFLESTTDLSTTAYKPVKSTTNESVFAFGECSTDHSDSYITVDQDSTKTKVPHSDRDEEQILILSRSNNRSPSPRPQTRHLGPRYISHPDESTLANRPCWKTGNRLIFHHCYRPRQICPECNIPLNKYKA